MSTPPPDCSMLHAEEYFNREDCKNTTETVKKRDKVLEKIVKQTLGAVDVS